MSEAEIPEFDDMERADGPEFEDEEVEWLDLDEEGQTVRGRILQVRENVGQHDSRVYKLDSPEHDDPVVFWGKVDINRSVDGAKLVRGDVMAVRVGEQYEGKNGTGRNYEVRYNKN